MSVSTYPTLRFKLTMPQALKLQFLPAVPGSNAAAAADRAEQAAQDAQNAADTAVAATANKVDKSGDVMTGFLTLNADPTIALHAATKQYVDSQAGSGSAPTNAEYITASANATLTNERVLTNTASVTWDFTTPGQAKAITTATGTGNVSNSGTPSIGQYAKWVDAVSIQGVAPATVLSDIGAQPAGSYLTTAAAASTYQPLDGDLTAIAALSGTNIIYYRSAANTWSPVMIGANLTFTGGILAAAGGGGGSTVADGDYGDITVSGTGTVWTIDANVVTNGKLRQGGPRSVIGVTGNATANVADIQGAVDQVLRVNGTGTALAFGTVAMGGIADNAVSYVKMQDVSAASLLIGRGSAAGAGDPQEITLGAGLSMTGTVLAAAGGGGNVSNSGTPTNTQYAKWVTSTTIQGVAPATVLSDIGALSTTAAAAAYQPLNGDLSAIAALTGTNVIYYRSAANSWTPVTIGTGLSFTTGTLSTSGSAGSAFTASSVAPSSPNPGDHWYDLSTGVLSIFLNDGNSSQWVQVGIGGVTSVLPKGYLYGLTLSNNVTDIVNDIDIAVGEAVDDSFAINMQLASILTKRLDAAWAVGNNQGGLDTGSIANTTYHVFLIRRPDTGVVDALFSTSLVAPVMPANYTQKRRILSFMRESAAIVPFNQYGDYVARKLKVADFDTSALTTTDLTCQLKVPLGLKLLCDFTVTTGGSGGATTGVVVNFRDPDETTLPTPVAGSGVGIPLYTSNSGLRQGASDRIMTNTSGQIVAKASAASTDIHISVRGWTDTRGRLG